MAVDELGNPSALDYVLKGGGKLYVADFGSENYVYIGESNQVNQNFEIATNSIPDTEGCNPGTLIEYTESTKLTLNFSSYSYTPDNVARFFLGEKTAGIPSVTAEEVILTGVVIGSYTNIGHPNITDLIVQDDTDTITYVSGVDYILEPKSGMIGIIKGGAIADGDDIHLTVTTEESGEGVQYLQGETKTTTLRFVGCSANGKDVVVDFYKANISGSGDAPLKGDEPVNISFSAVCLSDPSKTGTGISGYATMQYVNAVQ